MLKIIIGHLGSILTILYYTISAKPFINILKNTNINLERLNFYKILFNYVVSFFSYFYSDFIYYYPMINCSKFGIFFTLIFLTIYVYFQLKVDIADAVLNILMLSICSLSYHYYFFNILVDEAIFGYYFIVANLIQFFYLLYDNYFEYKNRMNTSFSFYSNICYTSSSFCWLIYGYINNDFYIEIPYGIETIFGFILILGNKYFEKIFSEYSGISSLNNDKINNIKNYNENTIEF